MAFTFEVEFSGLCLFLIHSDTTRIGVLMPNGRLKRDKTIGYYRDGQTAVPHVGYVRYNLRDVDSSMPAGGLDNPAFEVVHRFNFEEIDFGFAYAPTPINFIRPLELPNVSLFAPDAILMADPFAAPAGGPLLMRAVLKSGEIESKRQGDQWRFSSSLNPKKPTPLYEGDFTGAVTWRRKVASDTLNVTIKSFDTGGTQSTISFKPADGSTVHMKIANLCESNPLEWPELFVRSFRGAVGDFDNDFKWLYNVLEHKNYSFEMLSADRGLPLPSPQLTKPAQGVIDDCTGALIASDF